MKPRLALLLPAFMLLFNLSRAQEMNLIKTEIFSDLAGNFGLQYERIIDERLSASLSVNMMPKKGLPFSGIISNSISTNDEVEVDINDFKYSSFSVTPDFRYYFGEGYGQGFYMGPYLKYTQFNVHDFVVGYKNDYSEINDITLSGRFSTISGGVMCGAQWLLGDYICLDWWIAGFHGGRAKASITGDPSIDLTETEQSDLKEEFEKIDVPMFHPELEVSADKVTLSHTGPWFWMRGGLSIGIRF